MMKQLVSLCLLLLVFDAVLLEKISTKYGYATQDQDFYSDIDNGDKASPEVYPEMNVTMISKPEIFVRNLNDVVWLPCQVSEYITGRNKPIRYQHQSANWMKSSNGSNHFSGLNMLFCTNCCKYFFVFLSYHCS